MTDKVISTTSPTISIITICFNAEKHIEQTIQSVLAQDYPHIEYVIIDGASTDSTLSIIDTYQHAINYFISEPDTGIANAMNKGIIASSGDYLLFLHADDFLINNHIIADAVNAIQLSDKHYDIHAFSIYFGQPETQLQLRHSRHFGLWLNIKDTIFHQGTLCAANAFKKISLFDESFKIAMDYDWFLRAHRENISLLTHTLPITTMRDTGISSERSWIKVKIRLQEEKRVHTKNKHGIFLNIIYFLWWIVYPPFKRLTCQLRS